MTGHHYGYHDWPQTGEDCPVCARIREAGSEEAAIREAEDAAASEEIRRLKENWENDPCYDIEHVPGFEAHRAELVEFREKTEARWAAERRRRLLDKAEAIGCPENIKLAEYVQRLEDRTETLERDIRSIYDELSYLGSRS